MKKQSVINHNNVDNDILESTKLLTKRTKLVYL